ncbi:hypothetical protein AAC387_Pa08g0992 [Persea americana]
MDSIVNPGKPNCIVLFEMFFFQFRWPPLGGYVVVNEKLPYYGVPDLTGFKLKPYVAQCPREATTAEATTQAS